MDTRAGADFSGVWMSFLTHPLKLIHAGVLSFHNMKTFLGLINTYMLFFLGLINTYMLTLYS